MKKYTLLLAIVAWFTSTGGAAAQDNLGRQFWFAFPQNYINDSEQFPEITVSGEPGTIIQISQPASIKRPWHGTFTLNSRGYWSSGHLEREDVATSGHGRNQLGILLTADRPVAVVIVPKRNYSMDASSILPEESLGSEYFVAAYKENVGPYSAESQINIVATQDSTVLHIWPSSSTKDPRLGLLQPNDSSRSSHTLYLQKGETFQIQGNIFGNFGGGDLTGTYIRVLSPEKGKVAVFGGNSCSNVGITQGCGGYCDVLFEQQYPKSLADSQFVFVPFPFRTMDRIRIIATQDSTHLYLNGNRNAFRDTRGNIISLMKGQFFQYDFQTGSDPFGNTKRPLLLFATKPVVAAQYMASSTCGVSLAKQGGPSMMILPGFSHRTNQSYINVPDIGLGDTPSSYYLSIVGFKQDIGQIKLDGKLIPVDYFYGGVDLFSYENPVAGLTYAMIIVDPGTHTVEAPEGVLCYVSAVRIDESYAYANYPTKFKSLTVISDLETNELSTRLSLYPNPASQNLNFSYEGAAEVRVFDILGVQVASFSLRNEYKLDISGFAKGIYLIEVTAKEGKAVRRVVVE